MQIPHFISGRIGLTEKLVPLSAQRFKVPNTSDFVFADRVGAVLHVSPIARGRYQAG